MSRCTLSAHIVLAVTLTVKVHRTIAIMEFAPLYWRTDCCWMNVTWLLCSHPSGHSGCLQFETTERSTASNVHLFIPLYKFLCAKYVDLEIELLSCRSCLCSATLDNASLFIKIIVPVCISASSVCITISPYPCQH